MTDPEIAAIPNQIKSLFLPSNGSVHTSLATNGSITENPDNTPLLEYNFFSIQRVERLTGFELSSASKMSLNQPTWSSLNIDELEGSSGTILCRMSTYVNGNLGISATESYMLPILSKYFLISFAPEVEGVMTVPSTGISTSFGSSVAGTLAAGAVSNLVSMGGGGTTKSDTTTTPSTPNVSEPSVPGIYP